MSGSNSTGSGRGIGVLVVLVVTQFLSNAFAKGRGGTTDSGTPHECRDDDIQDCLAQCDLGNASSCAKAGYGYQHGEGVPENKALAVKLVTKACDGKDLPGCANLGLMYLTGDGVAADISKGVELTKSACDGKVDFACGNLGTLYADGKLVPKDIPTALSFYDKGCNLKNGDSCRSAGILLRNGKGITKDLKGAVDYFGKACDLNDGSGCSHLSEAYIRGEGVNPSESKALEFAKKACRLGDDTGCNNVQNLGGTMVTPTAIRQAEAKLPKLFEACAVNKSRIEKLRMAGMAAARSGNRDVAAITARKLQGIEAEWLKTLDELRQTITVLTNDEGPRFRELMIRTHRQCSCDATPSGRCRL